MGSAPARPLRAHALPLGVLAVVFAFGVVVADGYGLAVDQGFQRKVGLLALEYLRGQSDQLFHDFVVRYYGPLFEMGLLAVERVLGLSDSRHVFLSRYVASHAFFLVGAFACYLLAKRLYGSRMLALLALAFYLFHPRIYAHSFFNSKDVPFLGMFMIALLLAHIAFRKGAGALGAFALLGVWTGLIATVRPIAFALVGLVLAACLVDFLRAGSGTAQGRRGRIAATAAVFTVLSMAAFFAAMPYLWPDPVGHFQDWLEYVSNHPMGVVRLFMGEEVWSKGRPLWYLPVWICVTTPPMVLILALVGALALVAKTRANPRRVLANTPLRFEAVVAASFLLPALAGTLWVGNLFNGWRHMYVLYGPLCLLACGGFGWLAGAGGRRLARLGCVVVASGVGGLACSLVLLHPHQHVYFNFLVDRATPERLGTQFDLDYWHASRKASLDALASAFPEGTIPWAGPARRGERRAAATSRRIGRQLKVLPEEQRRRLVRSTDFEAFRLAERDEWLGPMAGADLRAFHAEKVYANTLHVLYRLREADGADTAGRRRYRTAVASSPIAPGRFDVYWDGAAITYIRAGCRPEDVVPETFGAGPSVSPGRFFLHVVGHRKDAPESLGRQVHNENFWFHHRGVVFALGTGEVCIAHQDLTDYAVLAVRTGQLRVDGTALWAVEFGASPRPR